MFISLSTQIFIYLFVCLFKFLFMFFLDFIFSTFQNSGTKQHLLLEILMRVPMEAKKGGIRCVCVCVCVWVCTRVSAQRHLHVMLLERSAWMCSNSILYANCSLTHSFLIADHSWPETPQVYTSSKTHTKFN